jgi:anti-sigma regulatory factor (Ser/Thr protein kinase)
MITDPSGVSEARRIGALAARQHGLNEELSGRVALVITEGANNIARHARSGMVILRRLANKASRGLEIIALDKGPGMENIARCMEDGYSTAGTQGTGLGAMRRMSGVFDIHSQPGMGTAVLSQVWDSAEGGERSKAGTLSGGVSVPMVNEMLCGDAWKIRSDGDVLTVMVADGLGHGPMANEAALEAVRVFGEHDASELPRKMELIHGALKKTRGAAVALAALDAGRGEIRFTGVGNIAGAVIHEGKAKSMVSSNGTVGHQLHRVQEFVYPWPTGSLVVLNSDGLTSQWSLSRYGALTTRHPGLVAGVLLRDYSRERDDATVLAVSKN